MNLVAIDQAFKLGLNRLQYRNVGVCPVMQVSFLTDSDLTTFSCRLSRPADQFASKSPVCCVFELETRTPVLASPRVSCRGRWPISRLSILLPNYSRVALLMISSGIRRSFTASAHSCAIVVAVHCLGGSIVRCFLTGNFPDLSKSFGNFVHRGKIIQLGNFSKILH